jgi:hypothetical protein
MTTVSSRRLSGRDGFLAADRSGSIGLFRRTLDSDHHPETDGGHETPGRLTPPLPPNSPIAMFTIRIWTLQI